MNPSDVAYDIARSRVEEQDRSRRHFDTMAWGVLGFSGAIVGLSSFTTSGSSWTTWSIAAFSLLVLSFLVTAFFVFNVVKLTGWKLRPVLDEFRAHIRSGEYEDNALISWATNEIAKAVDDNEETMSDKGRWLLRSYEAFVALVFIFGLFIASVISA